MTKRHKGERISQQELEIRLQKAYNSGYFDGYHRGVMDTSCDWVEAIPKVKGIGQKRGLQLQYQVMEDTFKRVQDRKREEEGNGANNV